MPRRKKYEQYRDERPYRRGIDDVCPVHGIPVELVKKRSDDSWYTGCPRYGGCKYSIDEKSDGSFVVRGEPGIFSERDRGIMSSSPTQTTKGSDDMDQNTKTPEATLNITQSQLQDLLKNAVKEALATVQQPPPTLQLVAPPAEATTSGRYIPTDEDRRKSAAKRVKNTQARNDQIRARLERGFSTAEAIARDFDLSVEYARQIILDLGAERGPVQYRMPRSK